MIVYVARIISLFAAIVQNVFHIAWLIGKVIVSALTGISLAVLKIIQNVMLFFQIVYEDNISVFTEELPSLASDVVDTISVQWSHLQDSVMLVLNDISCKTTAILASVKWLADAVVLMLCEVLVLFKSTVILVGSTVWFILTFVPVELPQLVRPILRGAAEAVARCVVDAYMALLKVTNFLTDVPLESFIGLTSAIVIVRLCVHFREDIQYQMTTLYWSILRKLWYYYYCLYNYFVDPEVREITRMSGEGVQEIRSADAAQSPPAEEGSAADALCVICQEREKCVLTLPCRHVCLCTDCCMRLYGYQRTCPICRTFIYHSVTVYL